MLNTDECQIVNDFLTAVAAKLRNNSNITLTEAEIVLSITAITLMCRENAAKTNTSFQKEFDAVFAEMFGHIDAATKQAICRQLGTLNTTAPGTLRKVADAILNAFRVAGRSIASAIAVAFSHVLSFCTSAWNFSFEKATMIYTYLCATGSTAYDWLSNAAPFCVHQIFKAYDWTAGAVVSVVHCGWDLLCKGFDLVKSALKAVLDTIGSVCKAIDHKLGEWFTPAIVKQTVMLTAPCKISLAATIIAKCVGYTYVSVVLNSTADLALLKTEIAGCGTLL
jgi:hypothetical protein